MVLPLVLSLASLDWSGMTVTCQIRESAEGPLLTAATVAATSAGVGEWSGTASLTQAQTASLPDRCTVFVRASRTSPAFGPHTVPVVNLQVATPGVR